MHLFNILSLCFITTFAQLALTQGGENGPIRDCDGSHICKVESPAVAPVVDAILWRVYDSRYLYGKGASAVASAAVVTRTLLIHCLDDEPRTGAYAGDDIRSNAEQIESYCHWSPVHPTQSGCGSRSLDSTCWVTNNHCTFCFPHAAPGPFNGIQPVNIPNGFQYNKPEGGIAGVATPDGTFVQFDHPNATGLQFDLSKGVIAEQASLENGTEITVYYVPAQPLNVEKQVQAIGGAGALPDGETVVL
ncbi:MAG: hypothetical protein M1833_000962 [Piccolia ochrophora]|nr:MAG: hypothetical protein M1833_000962 [Piccolia ochrophora]